jgi:foldase protein PrsA
MMMTMNNTDVSTIYEDKTGYYIVRMKNNNSSERYDSEVKQKISEAEDSAFETYFTKNIEPKHTYKYNKKELNKLTMGYITLSDSTSNLNTSSSTNE